MEGCPRGGSLREGHLVQVRDEARFLRGGDSWPASGMTSSLPGNEGEKGVLEGETCLNV